MYASHVISVYLLVATSWAWSQTDSYRLAGAADRGLFHRYVDGENVNTITFDWRADGSLENHLRAPEGTRDIVITADPDGRWTTITIESPQGKATLAREGDSVRIQRAGETSTLALKPGALIYGPPALLALVAHRYDRARGGRQTIPMLVLPDTLVDASIESLGPFTRRDIEFARYRFTLPNQSYTLWTDPAGRLCLADAHDGTGFVREGFDYLLRPEATVPDTPVAGEWQGQLSSALRLVIQVRLTGDGLLESSLRSIDQGNMRIPVDGTTLRDGALRLDMARIHAAFEGKLTADGKQIEGSFSQGGATVPLVFRRSGAGPRSTLKPVVRGRVPLDPCRTTDGNVEALCGKYEVFENREKRTGRKIVLGIMVLPAMAAKPAADPLFAIAGGPGQSAIDAYPQAGYIARIRQQRDVVLIDQRGTGRSNLLQCKTLGEAGMSWTFPRESLAACRTELETRADLTQYTTSIAADDLDEVREAMGFGEINVLGGSYGSLAALVYLHRHGGHVRTIALEGVAHPQYKLPLPFARTIQASLDRLIADCNADAGCHKDYPNLRTEVEALVHRLDKTPVEVEVGPGKKMRIDRGIFVSDLRPLLYSPDLAALLPRMLHTAHQGDWSLFGRAVVAMNAALAGQLARGMAFSVICSEDVPFITESESARDTEGTFLGDFHVRLYQRICQEWPRGTVPDNFFEPIRSDVPALLISGAQDPATPPAAAREAAKYLSHSRVISIDQGTHLTNSPCIDGLIADFVAKGTADGLDAGCVDQIRRPPFQ